MHFRSVTSALKSLGRDTIPVRARSAAPPRRRKARFVTGQEVSCPVNFYACGSFSRKSLLRNLLREPLCFTQPTLYRQLANATRPFCVGAPPLPKKACCAIFFGIPMFYARRTLQQGRNSPVPHALSACFLGGTSSLQGMVCGSAESVPPCTLSPPTAPLPKKFFDTFWEPCMRLLGHGACAAMQAPYFETRTQHTVLCARMRFSTSSQKIFAEQIFFGSPYFLQAGEIAVSFSHFVMWLNVK